MRELTRDALIGLASIIALVGLAVLLMRFGELDRYIEARYTVTLLINDAAGLHEGSEVRLDGVRVGNVRGITLRPGDEHPVSVIMRVDQEVRLPVGIDPKISVSLLGGAATLDLKSPSRATDGVVTFLPDDGTAQISGTYRTMLAELTAELDQRMAPVLASLEQFAELAGAYQEVGKNFNAVLIDAREALLLARSWLGDEQLRADARAAVHKANTLIDNATAAVERYSRLAQVLEGDAQQVVQAVVPLADQLGATLEDVRVLLAAASTGKGTIAQLLNNPDLYNSLNDAATRLDQALVDIRLLLQKIKAEGLSIKY